MHDTTGPTPATDAERASTWERRARALAAAFDEIANSDILDDVQADAVNRVWDARDERIFCVGCGKFGWPQDGFFTVEDDVGQCQPCWDEPETDEHASR